MYVDVIFKNGKRGNILRKEYEAGGDHIKCLVGEEKELEKEPENKELKKQTKKK
jgi:hypothetical protein